jgi:hypothetical protein
VNKARVALHAVLTAALLLTARGAVAQRCGDHLLLSFVLPGGKPLTPEDFASVRVTTENIVDNLENMDSELVSTGEVAGEGRLLETRTGCGLRRVEFRAQRGTEVMVVILRHVPGDTGNILLRDIEFRAGRYETELDYKALQAATMIEKPAAASQDGLEGPRFILRHPALRRID